MDNSLKISHNKINPFHAIPYFSGFVINTNGILVVRKMDITPLTKEELKHESSVLL